MLLTSLLIVTGIAVMAPTQLPKAARILGRFTGRSVRFLFQTKESIGEATAKGDSEVLKMKRDLDSLMGEFYSVRSDIRQGFNIRKIGLEQQQQLQQLQQQQQTQKLGDEQSSHGHVAFEQVLVQEHQEAREAVGDQQWSHVSEMSASSSFASVAPAQAPSSHVSSLSSSSSSVKSGANNFSMAFASYQAEKSSTGTVASSPVSSPSATMSSNTPSVPTSSMGVNSQVGIHDDLNRFRGMAVDPKTAPFASVNYSTQAMRGLQEDGFQQVRTENLGGGADLISKSILEKNFAQHAQESGMTEKDILAQWVANKKK